MTEIRGQKSAVSKSLALTATFAVTFLGAWLLALSYTAEAQQRAKVARIGVLGGSSASNMSSRLESFRQGLRELGYVEGQTIAIEYRYAEGKRDRHRDLANEMVGIKPDVIVVSSTNLSRAVKQATSTIPIVIASAGDLVGTGLVASLARPGGNVTGLTAISSDLSGKRLELLKEVVPKALRVAVFWFTFPGSQDEDEVKQTEMSAPALGIKIQLVPVRGTDEFHGAFAAMKKENASALVIIQGSVTNTYRKQLVDLAVKNSLPAMCEEAEWAEDGCLLSYGHDPRQNWRRAATYVDKILKDVKPGDLPVEQPRKFDLVINLKTAKQIGQTIPQSVLYRADKVIK
jgi:putative ABC transport system substrate-binding protein